MINYWLINNPSEPLTLILWTAKNRSCELIRSYRTKVLSLILDFLRQLGVYTLYMITLAEKHKLKNCACFNIRKSARVLTQHYDEAMAPIGLRATQFTILAVLSSVEAITVTEMADFLVMDRTTLTRNLRPLEKQGFLKIQPGEDRRTRVISLSKKGLNKLKSAIPLWTRAQKSVVKYLGDSRFKHLLSELNYVEHLPT